MSRRIPTLHDQIWPDAPEWSAIAEAWSEEAVTQMLTLVWDAFDHMRTKHLGRVDFTLPMAQLERSLTDLHAIEIQLLHRQRGSGFESFIPMHEAGEFSRISHPSAMPPSYDIGFVHVSDYRLRFPVEAKVLDGPTDVKRYLDDLSGKYLTGKGAPYTLEAALLGYLKSGQPPATFVAIESALGQKLRPVSVFSRRGHRASRHTRTMTSHSQGMPSDFLCHHLIVALSS
jgi:hypothetical protein